MLIRRQSQYPYCVHILWSTEQCRGFYFLPTFYYEKFKHTKELKEEHELSLTLCLDATMLLFCYICLSTYV